MGDSQLLNDLDRLHPPTFSVRRVGSAESFTRSGDNKDADAAIVRKSVVDRQEQQKSRGPSPLVESVKRNERASSSDTSIKTPSMSSNSSMGLSDYDGSNGGTPAPVQVYTSSSTTPKPIPLPVPIIRTNDEDIPLGNLQAATQRKRVSQMPAAKPGMRPTIAQIQDHSRTPSNQSIGDNGHSAVRATIRESTMGAQRPPISKSTSPVLGGSRRTSTTVPDQGNLSAPRPVANRASKSSPDLFNFPQQGVDAPRPGTSSDSDEDIPLAILHANGFPSSHQRRASQAASMYSSNMQSSRASTFGPATPSMAGAPRGSLPPFARKIPLAEDLFMDPSMAMGGNRMSVMSGMSNMSMRPPGTSPVPGMPPGGLVGVIAEEERFRGIRRAGPGAQLTPGMSMGMGNAASALGIPGVGPGLGGPAYPGMYDPNVASQQALMQTLQAIQQQNAMLHQMVAMQLGGGSMPGSPAMMQDGFGPMPGSPGMGGRPASVMGSQPFPTGQPSVLGMHAGPRTQSMVNLHRPHMGARSMSMSMSMADAGMGAGMPMMYGQQDAWETQSMAGAQGFGLGVNVNYAPSVAPSERSTIGQPSRYRPVSQNGEPVHGGSGGLSMNGVPMGVLRNQQSSIAPTAANIEDARRKNGMLSAVLHAKGSVVGTEDAEDEEDWGRFARRRRKTEKT
jgi:hypothetical protein